MRVLLLCAALLLARAACAADADPALVAGAQKEGQVVWYSTLIVNQIVRPMTEAFEAKYPGIKVQYSRATSSDVALKIRNEARARRVQADLFDGSNTVFLLEEANLVAEYQPQSAAAYPAELKDPKGRWTALNLFYWTSAYNTNVVTAADAPKTYEDLLDPKWKGKIAWTYDLTPGGPPGFVHNILTTMGTDRGMDYLRRFAAQEPVTIPAAQRVVLDKVVSGEYPLAVMILNYHATISMNQGAPVQWIRMEPLLQSMSLISIVKGSPHPNAARLFVEFMLSDEGQKVMADNDYIPASPAVPAKVPENKPDAGHFKVNVVTPDMARDDTPKWTATYKELFR
ncbi:MAG TPA: extracellular solute-binding protein [Acetobacteraceae bacterium]|jgi:iron(III) transport system substrate-binding protein|nr:extracellular solute-binding protein [Acetobacteraceae bacterium]